MASTKNSAAKKNTDELIERSAVDVDKLTEQNQQQQTQDPADAAPVAQEDPKVAVSTAEVVHKEETGENPVEKFDKDAFIKACGTKSAAIRALHAKGMKVGAIAKALDIKYQHARNVLLQPLGAKVPTVPATVVQAAEEKAETEAEAEAVSEESESA